MKFAPTLKIHSSDRLLLLVGAMPLSVDGSATETFRGGSAGNDLLGSLRHMASERAVPLPIRARQSGSHPTCADGIPAAGSSGASLSRRLHRDSFHEHRDRRSYSTEWISSPLLEGFASFHHALNSVQEVASNLEISTSDAGPDMNCSLPYLESCWSHYHSGESSVGSSRSTQSSMVSTETCISSSVDSSSLAIEDWDVVKSRSLSADIASPVPVENFMPFLFPMDPEPGNPQQASNQGTPFFQSPVFGPGDNQYNLHSVGIYGLDIAASGPLQLPPRSSSYAITSYPPSRTTQFDVKQTPVPEPTSFSAAYPTTPVFEDHHHHFNTATTSSLRTSHHQFAFHQPQMSPKILDPASTCRPMPTSPALMTSAAAEIATPHEPLPMADIQLLTKLSQCYWKNGRKNLQCFPICPEHNDFYSMKMSNRKHTSVGVCRGPIYTHVFLPAAGPRAKPSRTTGQHMKYEFGVGASGSGGSAFEIFVLGKFERVPQSSEDDELVELLPPPAHFTSSSEFESFRYSCFQAVEMEERRVTTRTSAEVAGDLPDTIVRSTWFFLPDVWKVQPMLKKKRKATRSAPAQAFPFCFRVFVYARVPGSQSAFACLASAASSFFELYSTRTVDRVKRKYWGRDSDAESGAAGSTPSPTHVAKRPSRE